MKKATINDDISEDTETPTLESGESSQSFHEQENICYKLCCLMLVVLANLSNSWSRTCIIAMFGYGVNHPEHLEAFYKMDVSVEGFDTQSYSLIVGLFFSILFAPGLLFAGYLSDQYNRKVIIGGSCFIWGLLSFMHGYVT